ncbi:MAG: phosphate ABC transporter substrate-binding protein [Gammaproteobacteria bacterium]|nr:MAG: phosphate ABC transporter substrate-binding protein [Gammaproteobacteria bacterium]
MRLFLSIWLVTSILVTACSGTDSSTSENKSRTLSIAGSSTVLPVVDMAAKAWHITHPGLKIILNGGGSGVGINQLGEGHLDIGMASREISRDEIRRFPQIRFVQHIIGRDAVVPVVSSEVFDSGVTALSLQQIGDIYRGKIRNWKQVGGPDRDILVVDKEKSRGTRHVFMQAVMGDKHAEAPGADLVLGSNNEEQTAIAQSDAAIGMLSLAWLNEDVKGLGIVMKDGSIVRATLSTIADGSYPISRNLNLYTRGQPQGDTAAFIQFLLGPDGQRFVEKAGYLKIRQ